MPVTAADIVDRAFRRLGIRAEDEGLSADQAAHGLAVLNTLMFGLRLNGINYTHAGMRSGDPFPLNEEFAGPVITLLAFDLAPDYSTAANVDCDSALRLLQMNLPFPIDPLRSDPFLLRRSPSNGWYA